MGQQTLQRVFGVTGLPAYDRVDLHAGLRGVAKSWDVSLWVQNAFDDDAITTILNDNAYNGWVSGYYLVRVMPKRTLGITASYQF